MSNEVTYSVKELANWVLDYADRKSVSLSNMSLNKLVYFAYEHGLKERGRKLTGAKIEAWEHGPVFREIYSSFKSFGADAILSRASRYNPALNHVEIVTPRLAPEDEQIMLESLEPLIRLPAYVLRELSHDQGGAWDRVWHHEQHSNPGMEISDDIILTSLPTAKVH